MHDIAIMIIGAFLCAELLHRLCGDAAALGVLALDDPRGVLDLQLSVHMRLWFLEGERDGLINDASGV